LFEDILILIGGPQGSGLETSATVLTRAFAVDGYYVLSDREYYSNIRGKHSYIHMRVSAEQKFSLRYPVDLVVAMDAESVFTHLLDIRENGFLVFDTGTINTRLIG